MVVKGRWEMVPSYSQKGCLESMAIETQKTSCGGEEKGGKGEVRIEQQAPKRCDARFGTFDAVLHRVALHHSCCKLRR